MLLLSKATYGKVSSLRCTYAPETPTPPSEEYHHYMSYPTPPPLPKPPIVITPPEPTPPPTRSPTPPPKLKKRARATETTEPAKPPKKKRVTPPAREPSATPSTSRAGASSSSHTSKQRASSSRSSSRRDSVKEDEHYVPPPKRARSSLPFGSYSDPISRSCWTDQDAYLEQASSEDVVRKLIHTYKPYFMFDGVLATTIDKENIPYVVLEYPNSGAEEKFLLLEPKDPQHYNPVWELMQSLELIIKYYIPTDKQELFGTFSHLHLPLIPSSSRTKPSPNPDYLKELRHAEKDRKGEDFQRAFSKIRQLFRDIKYGSLENGFSDARYSLPSPPLSSPNASPLTTPPDSPRQPTAPLPSSPMRFEKSPLSQTRNPMRDVPRNWKGVPDEILKVILSENYQRCVGPAIMWLKDYTPHSSQTYGELETPFISDIAHVCGINDKTKFMDLGSGVGNVVLQLSLQTGCQTFGVEIGEKPAKLAEKCRDEFAKRCRMWCVDAPTVELENSDFRDSARTRELLQQADVVLVNNFKFSAELNASLAHMFLDMREGATVITLQALLPESFRISYHTMSNPLAIFEQEEREYAKASVSWSHLGGKYFINRINRKPLQDFVERYGLGFKDEARRSRYNPEKAKKRISR
ncbi:DOT1-domain-containing protein [Sistotremastrum niveocremeum HHB9708]|uniref:Histone-lysine N-methyltransferase, H3 lysine-79 specific n=1 Tax=Sistotremastrum niveocremeum HHB9708 TaxID=1314777 RepID=A0A164R615_9AGAM|nr:DOT1-domain-containing protein [Sistotremastrum niveocremeum HHB9708]